MIKNSLKIKNLKLKILLITFITLGALVRFYNLNWGAPFYFHPDERNIASAVIQLSFPNQMSPHFFAYGAIPIYAIFFIAQLFHLVSPTGDLFAQSIIVSRFFSAILSTAIIPLAYIVGKKIYGNKAGLLASFFSTTSVGLIQYSHFGTFEIWLTFFSLFLFFICLYLVEKPTKKILLFAGITLGILIGTKSSSLSLLFLPILAVIAYHVKTKYTFFIKTKRIMLQSFLILLSACFVFMITNPFSLIDFQSFLSTIRYEASVAQGTLPVFYTQGFVNTMPVLYQFQYIYPFLINPVLTVIFILSIIYLTYVTIIYRNKKYLMLTSCYLLLFLPQALLYAKWTRYIVPTLPFIYLTAAIGVADFINSIKKRRSGYRYINIFIYFIVGVANIIFSTSYFYTVYLKPDTRIEALNIAKKNIANNTHILSEVYDLGITPFNSHFQSITLFNFYDMDQTTAATKQSLDQLLTSTNAIILPSQRLVRSRMLLPNIYPEGHMFYKNLLSGNSNFDLLYKTPCDIWCQIAYIGNPLQLEETTSVFDRPTVSIYKQK